MFSVCFRELSVGARQWGGECEAILELLPKGKSVGARYSAGLYLIKVREVIFVRR